MHHKKSLLAAAMLLSASSFNVQAQLTTTANGLGVYDSGLNATWTADANLLGTMESNPTAYGYADSAGLISAIIASDQVIYDTPNYFDGSYGNVGAYSGAYSLSVNDFGSNGIVDWFAAQALVHYLNTINYAGSNQWALPTTPDTVASVGYNQTSSQLAELYTTEFGLGPGGIFGDYSYGGQKNIAPFTNVQAYAYWSGTESASNPNGAWSLSTKYGNQYGYNKGDQLYAWAVSPGQVSAVPLPSTVWFFGTGMLVLLGLKRR